MNRPRKLTAAFVCSVNRPGRYGDGHGGYGLSLLVKPTTNGRWSKTWSQYARIGGNYTSIGLGSYPAVSLAEARAKALANRREMAAGRDPRNSGVPTLTEATEQVIALHRATWKSGSGAEARWRSAFAHHVLPALGDRQVDKIAVGDVLGVLVGPWVSNPATGRFLAQRLSQVFRWSMGKGYRSDDPTPAATAALPRHNGGRTHHAALHHTELPEALRKVRSGDGHPSAALCWTFIALTACRSAEATGARWSEVDTEAGVWTVPGGRTKTGREHRVALSGAAAVVLKEAPKVGDGELVFPSPRGKVLASNALHRLLKLAGVGGTTHGLRTSFRSWAAESDVTREVAEAALGHVVPGVEGAYQRSDLLEARRTVMEDWANYLTQGS